ncbi:STAS domain-containing protein [Succinimonas amylolytica]|uniref:STAS domain-containing protein n=1 Tax=Succinimonas amylolytica TaxID=83769 RepID=UPI0003A9AD65|nr:STAS domain-containing protein [Succinimonas amylolytica]
MDITITENDTHTLMAVSGRIDAITSPDLDAKFNEYHENARKKAAKLPVVLDLSQAEYISSAGLRSVLKMAKTCNAEKNRLLICGIQPLVYEVFRISGFVSILTIVNTREDALAML